jgi:hypothetical protein
MWCTFSALIDADDGRASDDVGGERRRRWEVRRAWRRWRRARETVEAATRGRAMSWTMK